jgi:hypothetical protein
VHDGVPETEAPSRNWVPKTPESKKSLAPVNDISKQLDVPIESLEVALNFNSPVSTQNQIPVASIGSGPRVPPPTKQSSLPPILTHRVSQYSKDVSSISSHKKKKTD